MEDIMKFFTVDFQAFIYNLFIIISAIVSGTVLIKKFCEIIGKPIKFFNRNNEDHEMTLRNAVAIEELAEQQKKDTDQSIAHDKKIESELSSFMIETKSAIDQFLDNRVHDREQSFAIQDKWTEIISSIEVSNKERDVQITALTVALRETLADKINQKYKQYISMEGIPEDEVDEFTNLHLAYKGVGGNHSGDAKFDYVMSHLQILPVKINVMQK